MAALLELLYAALARLATVLGLAQSINALLGSSQPNPQTDLVLTETDLILVDLTNPTYGLSNLNTQLTNLSINLASDLAAIELAITNLTNGVTPVSLPVTPPSGYGSQTLSDIANAVWNNLQGTDLDAPYEYVKAGGLNGLSVGNSTGYRPDGGIFAYYYMTLDSVGAHATFYASGNYANILATDTLLTWLTRENPGASVNWWAGPGSNVEVIGNNGDGNVSFLTVFDDAHFREIRSLLFPDVGVALPPVWPGLSAVTLGTPVAITIGGTITLPCDGAIVTLTAVPLKQGYFSFGTNLSYRNVGAIAFVDDNGEIEFPQTLGFTSAVYAPKSMSSAAGIVYRASDGVTGTITPWVINSSP